MKTLDFYIVHQLLTYCSSSGVFRWRQRPREYFKTKRDCKAWNTMFAGKVAGSKKPNGYVYVRMLGTDYLAHRLAIVLTTGIWPAEEVDHINRMRSDNRIVNLRLVSGLQNHQNMSKYKSNSSGVPGVHFCNTHNKWKAKVTIAGRVISLGYYINKSDAIAARLQGEQEFKPC